MKSMHFSSATVQSISTGLPAPARNSADIAERNPPSSRRDRQNKIRLDDRARNLQPANQRLRDDFHRR